MFVPVTYNEKPLMPTKPSRARRWIRDGKATPYWSNGIFCVRLNVPPSDAYFQEIAVGIDPGSKREAFTAKSASHTYLNVQAKACGYVGKKLEKRRNSRRQRRQRKTPCRQNKTNRLSNAKRVPAGTRARWAWKLRVFDWLCQLYPVTRVCVEDIRAGSRQGQRRWNASFNPLQVGKEWFYTELFKRAELHVRRGQETKAIRDALGLSKSSKKLAETFNAHCVDSWCLAYAVVGGDGIVDNTRLFCIEPIEQKRRCLHRENYQKGGVRPRYGGTMSLGWKRQTAVKHQKYGICLVGGYQKGRLSLHDVETGKRLTISAKSEDCKRLKRVQFRYKPIERVTIKQTAMQLTLF